VFPLSNRISYLQDKGLETAKFTTATFEVASIALPHAPVKGESLKLNATGKLTIHGVAKVVTMPITASWNGAIIDVSGSFAVKLTDYSIEPPSLYFVKVTDVGTIEFKVAFTK